MSGRASWSRRASRSRTSPRSGRRSGRSGATRCSRRCAGPRAATTSGASGCHVGRGRRHEIQFFQFVAAYEADYVTRDGRLVIDDPEVRRRLIKAIDSYTAIYRKGCTPPDAVTWDDYDNNKAFLAQTVVMTPNHYALDPQRAQARAARRLLQEHRDDRMAARPGRRALSRSEATSFAPWSSRTAATSPPPRSSCAFSWPRAGSPTISTSPASASCRRCRSCSSSRSGSTRATRTAWPR